MADIKSLMKQYGGNPADAAYWENQLASQGEADFLFGDSFKNMTGQVYTGPNLDNDIIQGTLNTGPNLDNDIVQGTLNTTPPQQTDDTPMAGIKSLMKQYGGNPADAAYWENQLASQGEADFLFGDSFKNMTGQVYTGPSVAGPDDVSGAADAGIKALTDAKAAGNKTLADALTAGRGDVTGGKSSALSAIENYYKEGVGYFNPYLSSGTNALGALNQQIYNGPGELTESEGYQYRQKEAMNALEGLASAKGYLGDPRMAEEMMRTSQGLASDERARFLNEYYQSLAPKQQMAEMGMTAAGEMGRLGETAGLATADIETRASEMLANMGLNVGTQRAAMGMDVGKTALSAKMSAVDADMKNALEKYGINVTQYGIDQKSELAYAQLDMDELLALREQAWQSGEFALARDLEERLTKYGIDKEFDLGKYGIDKETEIALKKLGLDELLALRDQAWKSGELELARLFDIMMAEKGYDVYKSEEEKNRRNTLIRDILKGMGFVLGLP